MSTGTPGATAGDRTPESSGPGPGGLGTAGSALVGSALVAFGLKRRSLVGTAAALAGGWLLYRAVDGRGGGDSTPGGGGAPARGRDESETAAAGDAAETDVTRTVTVGTSPDEAYEAWNDAETQAQVFEGFADVTPAGEGDWRWELDTPFGRTVAWETRTVEDRPGELVRWEATGRAATVVPEGSVRFASAPADRGTEVTLRLRVDPPGGSLGRAALERLDVVPRTLAGRVLYRFKSLVETGEIPTLEGNISGRGTGDLL